MSFRLQKRKAFILFGKPQNSDAPDTDWLKILPFHYRTALKTEIRTSGLILNKCSYERFTDVGDLLADAKKTYC